MTAASEQGSPNYVTRRPSTEADHKTSIDSCLALTCTTYHNEQVCRYLPCEVIYGVYQTDMHVDNDYQSTTHLHHRLRSSWPLRVQDRPPVGHHLSDPVLPLRNIPSLHSGAA